MKLARVCGMFSVIAQSNPSKGLRDQGGESVATPPPLSFVRHCFEFGKLQKCKASFAKLQRLFPPRHFSPDTMQHGRMMPPHDAPDLR